MAAESSVGARLDRLPIARFHRRILALIGAGLFLDSFDIYMQGPVLAYMISTRWSDAAGNAQFISSTFAGLVVGALVSARLGDRLGRRTTYQVNLLIFGSVTLLAAWSPTFSFLVFCRFLIGIGLGGEVIVGYGTLAEFVPARVRGRWQGMLAFLSNLGLPASAFLSLLIIPRFGWRWMFGIVGVLSLLVWTARKRFPESPRWLESRGRKGEAEAQMASIEAEVKDTASVWDIADDLLHEPGPEEAGKPVSAISLFRKPLLRRTILAMLIMICANVSVYAFTAWLPTILFSSGMSMTNSLLYNSLMQLGSLPGALIGAWVIDRFGRRPALISFSLVAAVVSCLYAFMHSPGAILAVGFMLTLLLYALVAMSFGTYVPEIFPTHIRLTGVGLSNASGRIANVFAPYGLAALMAYFGAHSIYFAIGAVLLVKAAGVWRLAEETRCKSLEEIEQISTG